jgi:hypothetical protein
MEADVALGSDRIGAPSAPQWVGWLVTAGQCLLASRSPGNGSASAPTVHFHDALLHFAKVIDSLQVEVTAEDIKIIDEVQIYYPGRSRVRQGVLGGRLEALAHWRKDELIIQEKNEFGTLIQSLVAQP